MKNLSKLIFLMMKTLKEARIKGYMILSCNHSIIIFLKLTKIKIINLTYNMMEVNNLISLQKKTQIVKKLLTMSKKGLY